MSDNQIQLTSEMRSELCNAKAELARLQQRFADFKRQLDEPTRTIDRSIPDPVIVSSVMIQQVWACLEAGPGSPVMVCQTTDGRITSWRTLSSALKQANASNKQIGAVSIANELSTAKADVRLYATKVAIHVYGEEADAEKLFADLEADSPYRPARGAGVPLVRDPWPQRGTSRRRRLDVLRCVDELGQLAPPLGCM